VSKQSLLLVDGDTRSLRVLEVSLRKAGFTVTPASSVADALDKLELHTPDLIISETKFPTDLDGFELRRRVRGVPDWAEIPFVFLTAETAIEHKIRGLELGVDDYLTKPIYIKEIVTRINILLQKRQRAYFDERKDGVRFAGRVADMPVVDVIQTIEVSRKSGVIQFVADRQRTAAIYFRDGKVIDAEAGTLQGEDAVYRLLTWSEGEFEVVFRTVRRREVILTSSQGLLMEGMRRLDEWSRLLEQLPPLTHRFEVDTIELSGRLGDVPDDNNPILRMFDGKRSLLEVIDASDFGDLECLQAIARLYFEGLLLDLDPAERPKRDTGKPMPLVMVENAPTPIEEVASGPIYTDGSSEQPMFVERIRHPTPAPPAEPDPDPVFSGQDDHLEDAAPRDSTETINTADVLSEEDDIQPPLSGSYRPSSLRLIDEAVAAAQAIDPSLFESDLLAAPPEVPTPVARVQLATRESDPRIANARNVVERVSSERLDASNGHDAISIRIKPKSSPPPVPMAAIERAIARADASSEIAIPDIPEDDYSGVPTVIEAEAEREGTQDRDDDRELADEVPTSPGRPPFVPRREDSGLRMIGSLGRDRAEASGELVPPRAADLEATDSARELVTIMPRRITREIPVLPSIVGPEDEDAPVTNVPLEPPPYPILPPPPRRISVAGGVRRASGPGPVAMVLVVVAACLAGMAITLYLRKARRSGARSSDAGVVVVTRDAAFVAPEPDAEQIAIATPDARVHVSARDAGIAVVPLPDAAVRVAVVDAGVRVAAVDAGVRVAAVDAGVRVASSDGGVIDDKAKEARALLEQAHAALEDGDPDKALQLADASLKLRKTARTFLERARALQRLGQVDEALKSVDSAMEIVSDYAPAWEQRGMILWSARRHDEARPALEKYLELDPNGRDAPSVRQMLGQP
jgi:DNA-binding response OmpR family regulator